MNNSIGCVNVIGAGLAGAEAAYQLSRRGVAVRLFDMKPQKMSPAHTSENFGELVCSNSLRAAGLSNAAGLLKEEMRRLGSLIMRAADANSVPAGGALAVERNGFSQYITDSLNDMGNIEMIRGEVTEIPHGPVTVVATGPLTSDALSDAVASLTGTEHLHFFDAAAPIVTDAGIDKSKTFCASRYGKGDSDDYLNCPMDKEQYEHFWYELTHAQCAQLHGFEDKSVFEGCMPVETMAKRGIDTLRFGPMKPVGLTDPVTGRKPYAVVQLRREDMSGTAYNLVGFQTRLIFSEQRRVFGMIPALANAEFVRYGVMHRNTYLDSPRILDKYYRLRADERIRFAGQITGVEGYIESAASGLLCGIYTACDALSLPYPTFDDVTAIGALPLYISSTFTNNFQPMNINFSIIAPNNAIIRDKRAAREAISARALEAIDRLKQDFTVLEDTDV